MIYEEKKFPMKDNKVLTLRNAERQDAQLLIDYLKKASGETPFLLRYPDEIKLNLEEEEKFIQNGIEDPGSLNLVGFIGDAHVGNGSFRPVSTARRYAHRCDVAIALYQAYTGYGIGRILLKELLKKASEAGYEQAELTVVSKNTRALRLYQSLGFMQYGKLPHSMKYDDGTYADEILMVKDLKDKSVLYE